MTPPSFTHFRSFRSRIILSFIGIITIILCWLLLFFYSNRQNKALDLLSSDIYVASNEFSKNINNFQSFLISGYKQASFYENGNQIFIDIYIENLHKTSLKIDLLEKYSYSTYYNFVKYFFYS